MLAMAGAADAAEPVGFARDIVPILKKKCVMCHLTGQEPGKMKLPPRTAYASLVGMKSLETPLNRVEPGKPDSSYLVRKLEGTHGEVGGSGERMPMSGDPLPPADLATIRRWIEQGAPNN